MDCTAAEALTFIAENDVKFIRLVFCDLFGQPKNISIMPSELPRAFASGISFDATAIPGFAAEVKSDLLLFPDPTTMAFLPWRPAQGRVMRMFCSIRHPDGLPFAADGRYLLAQAVARAQSMGYECRLGPECEFYLFELDAQGRPTINAQDQAGYMDLAPWDKGENVRREICLTLEEMDIYPESSHHEQGPGQNEIDFRYSDPVQAADNLLTFRSVVKTIAAQHGLFASFMPKPLPEVSGSGLHVNLSLARQGQNIFAPDQNGGLDNAARHFVAGVLAYTREITAFLNPLTNSYRRFGYFEAPRYITWSSQNRSQLIRIPAASAERSRLELRSPDPALNPYLAFTLIVQAGLEGLQKELPLPEPLDINLYHAAPSLTAGLEQLPQDLGQAVALARGSELVRRYLPAAVSEAYLQVKVAEQEQIARASDALAAEQQLYFRKY